MLCNLLESKMHLKRSESSNPNLVRKIEQCNDVERNPGPRQGSSEDSAGDNNNHGASNGSGGGVPIHDNPRVERIGKNAINRDNYTNALCRHLCRQTCKVNTSALSRPSLMVQPDLFLST